MDSFAEKFFTACNNHQKEEIISFYHADYQGESIANTFGLNGVELMSFVIERAFSSLPDIHFTVQDTITQDNKLAVIWYLEGTQMGKLMNIPPTKRKLRVKGITIFELRDDKIIKSDTLFDMAGMLRQMGLLPEMQFTKAI
jgi:steroid delta-isomerase-like uncharacterized protein